MSDLCSSRIGLHISSSRIGRPIVGYINRSQTHECGNWDWDPDIPFLWIFVSKFWYFVFTVKSKTQPSPASDEPRSRWACCWAGGRPRHRSPPSSGLSSSVLNLEWFSLHSVTDDMTRVATSICHSVIAVTRHTFLRWGTVTSDPRFLAFTHVSPRFYVSPIKRSLSDSRYSAILLAVTQWHSEPYDCGLVGDTDNHGQAITTRQPKLLKGETEITNPLEHMGSYTFNMTEA